jgi:uncharacterized protein
MKTKNHILKSIFFFLAAFSISGLLFAIQEKLRVPGEAQLPMYGPALSALVFLRTEKQSIGDFLLRSFTFRINVPILLGLLIPIVLMGCISYFLQAFWGMSNVNEFNITTILFIVSMFFAVIGEELGWRGYLLPKLQEKYTPSVSSFIVGVIWIVWHIPTKIMPLHLFISWAGLIMALCFLITFVYNKAKPSVWPAILLHFISNIMGYLFLQHFLLDAFVTVLTSITFVISAILLVLFDWKAFFSKPVTLI